MRAVVRAHAAVPPRTGPARRWSARAVLVGLVACLCLATGLMAMSAPVGSAAEATDSPSPSAPADPPPAVEHPPASAASLTPEEADAAEETDGRAEDPRPGEGAAPGAEADGAAGAFRQAPASGLGCAYADADSGPMSSQLCWLDFAGLTFPRVAESRTPVSVTITSGVRTYTLTATVRITGHNAAGQQLLPERLPTYGGAFLGNRIGGKPFYTFTSNRAARPALYQRPVGGNRPSTTVALEGIQMVENLPGGGTRPVVGYSIVVVDAESTDSGESIEWSTSGGTGLTELPNSASSPRGNACSARFAVTGRTAVCQSANSVQRTGAAMLYASANAAGDPWSISQTMNGSGRQAVAFAIAATTAQATVEVTERIDPDDQFTVGTSTVLSGDLTSTTTGAQTSATATTGPLFLGTAPRVPVRMSVAGANLSNYAQSWTCALDGRTVYTGSAPPPQSATSVGPRQHLRCTVTLRPARLTIVKSVTNSHGGTSTAADWTLTASLGGREVYSASSGMSMAVPAGALELSETPRTPDAHGYAVQRWTCTQGGRTILNTTAASPGLRIQAGQDVNCTVTNADLPGTMVWGKRDASTGLPLGGSSWTLTGPGVPAGTVVTDCATPRCQAGAYRDQDPAPGALKLTGLAWGSYTAAESTAPAGYLLDSTVQEFSPISGASLEAVPLFLGETGALPNERLTGSVTWSKTDVDNGAPLSGSTWTLTGPGVPPGTVVADCVAAGAAQCPAGPYADTDHRSGRFTVRGLAWDTATAYSLTEAAAPPGYIRDPAPRTFSILPQGLDYVFAEPLTNAKAQVPNLPLTGGMGADAFLISGTGLTVLALGLALHRRWAVRRARR